MIDKARQRVQRHGWRNVTLLCSPAEEARIRGRADAALLHFTHDVMQSDAALDHVLRHLKPGATAGGLGPEVGAAMGLAGEPVRLACGAALGQFVGRAAPALAATGPPGRRTRAADDAGRCVYLARARVPAKA